MTMTMEQAATEPGLTNDNDRSLEAVRARIALFCERFNVPVPKLKTRRGAVYLTDDLHAWLLEHGASFDWILLGDPIPLLAAYRESIASQRRFEDATKGFDKTEREMLIATLRAIADGKLSVDDAMGAFRSVFEERREQMAEGADTKQDEHAA